MFFFCDEIDLSVIDFSDKNLIASSFQFEKDQIFTTASLPGIKEILLWQKLF